MEGKKYLKNIWSRVFFILGILLVYFVVMHIYKNVNNQLQEEQLFEEQFKQLSAASNRLSFIVMNVSYHDTVYRVVVREEISYLKKKYQKVFERALNENDTLSIDSITYSLLETKIVKPQYQIDSVYNGEMKNLVSAFFNEQGAVSDSLSNEEIKYLIDILFQNNVPMNVDCETGALIINE